MAFERRVTTNRGVQFSVGVVHVLLGVGLAFFMNHYLRNIPVLLGDRWYDSYWLPLWVACLAFVFEAMFVQLPADWLYGLLITAPPYGWYAILMTVIYLENRRDVGASDYAKEALPALLLALCGAILNPVIVRLVSRVRNKR
jgi:hypothetical protein